MTHTAIILCRDMIRCLAGRDVAVMAGCAIVNDAIMIKRRPYKCVRTEMTDRTILSGWQMIGGLS